MFHCVEILVEWSIPMCILWILSLFREFYKQIVSGSIDLGYVAYFLSLLEIYNIY